MVKNAAGYLLGPVTPSAADKTCFWLKSYLRCVVCDAQSTKMLAVIDAEGETHHSIMLRQSHCHGLTNNFDLLLLHA